MKSKAECLVYLIRHGEVENAQTGPCLNGHFDVELSRKGLEQIRRVSALLKSNPINAVYSSNLRRTYVGASIVGEPHGCKPITCPELREIRMGQWEGRSIKEIEQEFPGKLEYILKNFEPFPEGESYEQLRARVIPKFLEIVERHRGQSIVIMAHGGVNMVILSHALGMPARNLFAIKQDYASINIIRFHEHTAVLELMNGTGLESFQ